MCCSTADDTKSHYRDTSCQHGIVRKLQRKHTRLGKVWADDEPAIFVVANFPKTLYHILEVDVWSNLVDLGNNLIAPNTRAPTIPDDKIRIQRRDGRIWQTQLA